MRGIVEIEVKSIFRRAIVEFAIHSKAMDLVLS